MNNPLLPQELGHKYGVLNCPVMYETTKPRIPFDLPKYASEGSLYTRQETAEVFQGSTYEPILPNSSLLAANGLQSVTMHNS